MMSEGFDTVVDQGVLEIAFNRPDRRNPLSYATINGLIQALQSGDSSSDVRSILLYGQGTAFTAGGDLAEFKDEASQPAHELHKSGNALATLLTMIPRLTKPLVVAAHGYCMAGGLGLLASADVALGARSTVFSMSEIKIGLFPLMVLPPVRDAIGLRRARELSLTGRRFDTDEALRIGLVHEALADEGFIAEARNRAQALATFGTFTMSMGKQYLVDIDGMPHDNAIQLGRAVRGAFMTSPDFEEGAAAFLEKRSPNFR